MKFNQLRLRTYSGVFHYNIIPTKNCPRKYDVVIPTSTEPFLIGRELTLTFIKGYIKDFEQINRGVTWFGGREQVVRALRRYKDKRYVFCK